MASIGSKKRKIIFDRYSENLKEVLKYHNVQLAQNINGKMHFFPGSRYVCPLCFKVYSEESISLPEPALTLEHNPPKSTGGNANILTCKICNNSNGSSLDTAIGSYLRANDFIKQKPNSNIPVQFHIQSHKFKGELGINTDNDSAFFINQCSNKYGYNKIAQGFQDQSIDKINFTINLPNYDDFAKSCLKIAHLTAFETLGYSYLFNKSGYFIARVLNGDIKHPCSNFGLLGFDFPDSSLGINLLKQPEELKGVIIVLKIRYSKTTKNVGVLLPSFSESGNENLSNLYKYYNTHCTVDTTRFIFSSKPIPPSIFGQSFAG